jgi:death on curing protein
VSRGVRWVSKTLVLAIHDRLIAEHGGPPGVLDDGALEAALAAPRNHFHYAKADWFAAAAVYAHALTRNHPFLDGNKRVALTVAGVFLQLNGHRLEAPERDAFAAMQALSDRSIGLEEFAIWLRDNSGRAPRTRSRK